MTVTVSPDYRYKKTCDLQPGDIIDLAGDPIVDPHRTELLFACEYVTVAAVPEVIEPDCVAVDIEGGASYRFPPEHVIRVHGHDTDHDLPIA